MARARTFGPRGSKRRTHWTGAAGIASISATGSTILAINQVGHEGETLVRVRGLAAMILKTVSATGDGFTGAFGIAKVTSAAAAAGVGSIPTPITEVGWDGWLWHSFFTVLGGLSGGADGAGFQRIVIDSKAMRKMNEDEAIVLVSEQIEVGTATATITMDVRMLSMVG